MEDSTFQGWTTPLGPYPEGRKLPSAPARGYVGEVRSLPRATEESIRYAARTWPQGRAEDFERDGRRFTDSTTGLEYTLVHGNPLLGDAGAEVADLFIVEDDCLLFLRRTDAPSGKSVVLGSIGGQR